MDKAYFLNLCCLRKKNYHADLVSTGRHQLSRELEVSRLLKNQKYSKSAIESILTPAQLRLNKLQKRVTAVKEIKLDAVPSSSSDEGRIEDLVKQCRMNNHTDCHLLLGLANTKVTEDMFNDTLKQRLASAEAVVEADEPKPVKQFEETGKALLDNLSAGSDSLADTFVKFGDSSSQHLNTEYNQRKNTYKGSNASVVLEEPSKEDVVNERASLTNKASAKSVGRTSTVRRSSHNSYSPTKSANSRGRGMTNQRSQESYRMSSNIGVFS